MQTKREIQRMGRGAADMWNKLAREEVEVEGEEAKKRQVDGEAKGLTD